MGRSNSVLVPLLFLATSSMLGCRTDDTAIPALRTIEVPIRADASNILDADLAVDDSGFVHVVYGIYNGVYRANTYDRPIEYLRGRLEADSVRWEGTITLLHYGGDQVRIVAGRSLVHILGEGLRHWVSTNRGELWSGQPAAPILVRGTVKIRSFAVASRGDSLLVAAVLQPDAGPRDDRHLEFHIGTWAPPNRVTGQRLAVLRSKASSFKVTPALAVSGPLVHVVWAIQATLDSAETTVAGTTLHRYTSFGAIDHAQSLDGGATWSPLRRVPDDHPAHSPDLWGGEANWATSVALVAEGEEAWIYIATSRTIERRRLIGSGQPQVVHRFMGEPNVVDDEKLPMMAASSIAGMHTVIWLRKSHHKYALGDPRLLLARDPAIAERVVLDVGGGEDSIPRRLRLPRWKLRSLRPVVRGGRLYTLWINHIYVGQDLPSERPALFLTIDPAKP